MVSRGEITLVPSVHYSETHRRRVRERILETRPDLVAVELDDTRFERFRDGDRLRSAELARRLPPPIAAAYNTLRTIQRSVLRLYGLDSEKTDMEAAIETAAELDLDVALIDDPIEETMTALWSRVGLETLPKLLVRMTRLTPEEYVAQFLPLRSLAEVETGDDVQAEIDRLRKLLPEVVEVLIDDRDRAMAERLDALSRAGYDVVAVIGAGHHNGILAALAALEGRGSAPDVEVPIRTATRGGTRIPIS